MVWRANQKTTGKQGRHGRPGGGDYTRLWPLSGIFPADPFDVGRSISDGLRTDVVKVMPRQYGHGLSWPPDSGISLSSDGRTQGSGVGRFDQSTFRQSISQPPRRKRRAAGQMMTDSDMGLDVMPEGTQRGTLRKRALFGPGCSHSVSPVRGPDWVADRG